jgi:sterol desaturase/sphingolipid hydroxylase (fatty acid hydroxylase superfamily)
MTAKTHSHTDNARRMTPVAETVLRLGVFLGVFAALALWEILAPRRAQTTPRLRRWPANLAIVAINTAVLRLLIPITGIGMALLAQAQGWGLFNMILAPGWLAALCCIVLLDLLIYGQHIAFHTIPPLWRLHRMHHADMELDVSSGIRFHPGEILLSMGIKLAAIATLGAPPPAVLAFEVLLNATALFNHANIALPGGIDRFLRWLVVTPDMHRIHHSTEVAETDSNFGFNIPLWDHLFGTYRADPAAGQHGMTIGLTDWRDPRELRLDRMLLQPLRDPKSDR